MVMVESPSHTYLNYSPFNRKFNISMTYKKSSEIYLPFIVYEKTTTSTTTLTMPEVPENYAAGKSRLVAWFVSHCPTAGLRERYVEELQKYIPVDIYGRCGSLKCPRTSSELCDLQLKKKYKFYLSFENSLCKQYLTEKVYKMLNLNVIPVVLGGAKYSDYISPHSYRSVRDFTSPKKLAEYLQMLDRNDTLYNSYFAWKGKYQIVKRQYPPCAICQYLQEHQGEQHIIKRLDLFWNRFKDCYDPRVYYKGIAHFIDRDKEKEDKMKQDLLSLLVTT
jgi:hypothetical protein